MVHLQNSSKILKVEAMFQGRSSECEQLVYERKAYSLILSSEDAAIKCKLVSVGEVGTGRRRGGGGVTEGWRHENETG